MRPGGRPGEGKNTAICRKIRPPRLPRAPGRPGGGGLAAADTLGIVATSPSAHGAERLLPARRRGQGAAPRSPDLPPALRHGRFDTGTPAVGALFTVSDGQLGPHFWTASVWTAPSRTW